MFIKDNTKLIIEYVIRIFNDSVYERKIIGKILFQI